MVVTTHVAGQENGNLDLIREYDIGWVEENTTKATKLILSLLTNPQQLQSKQKQLVKMRAYNVQAKSKLVTLVKSLLANR